MKRWPVPVVPFLFSLALSLATVGSSVYWQDSGFYLCAIREMAVLYPPGFVLYQILCKAWTLTLPFLDFTLRVHLFSSFCAAGAAASIALAALDLLRAKRPPLCLSDWEPGAMEAGAAIITGCLAASGYTFWMAAIYAKGYSFYYLLLALLLWRMIRALESGRPRDFTMVAILIGLAWQAHPSAVGIGFALVLFVAFVRKQAAWKGIAWRAGLAALCGLGPSLLLPLLARSDSLIAFGHPQGLGEVVSYLTGHRFVSRPDAFGVRADRLQVASQFFWEEFLGVSILLMTVGLVTIGRRSRGLLASILCWTIPYSIMTWFFVMEGQHDHWYLAAWLPLYMAIAVGLREAVRFAGRFSSMAMAGVGIASLLWSVAANYSDLNQRGFNLPELMGRFHLAPLAPRAAVLTTSDDATGSMYYLQIVRGLRPDVLIVRPGHLAAGEGGAPGWYDQLLRRRDPQLPELDYAEVRRRFPNAPLLDIAKAAFVNAVAPVRPVYLEEPLPPEMLHPDYVMAPAGPLTKVVPRGKVSIELRDWEFPISPERVRMQYRRKRGISVQQTAKGFKRRQDPYERRLLVALLRAQASLASWHFSHGDYMEARRLYESILQADPETAQLPDVLYPLAISCRALGDSAKARALFLRTLSLPDLNPAIRLDLERRLRGN